MVCSAMVLSGMVWYGMVWSGIVWSGMVWLGIVWSGMVLSGLVKYLNMLGSDLNNLGSGLKQILKSSPIIWDVMSNMLGSK